MHLTRSRSASGTHPSPQPAPPSTPKKTRTLSMEGITNMLVKMRQSPDKVKPNHTECSSGDPKTHPSLEGMDTSGKVGPFTLKETFICVDAVNMFILLGAVRDSLLKYAISRDLSVLVDEQWKYIICSSKHRTYRIQVWYTACFVNSDSSDPHKAVALDQVQSIPGCMTIRQRNQD